MRYFKTFNHLFNKYLAAIVVLVSALAIWQPQWFTWASGYVTVMLQFIMFTMGLTLTPDDFAETLKKPDRFLVVEALQYGVQPLIAVMIARLFQLDGEVALGLILVGSVPGGTSSNVFTYMANGDVPLSVGATSLSTLLSPLVTPFLLSFYGSAYLEIAFWPMFLSIVQVVLLPIVLGFVVNYFFGDKTEKLETALPTFSSIGVLLVLAGTVSVNQAQLLETGGVIFLAVFLLNLSGYALGHLSSYLLNYSDAETRAIAIEVGLQNTGLAASLGLAHFSPTTALAGAAGTVIHTLFGTLYAKYWAFRDEQKAKETDTAATTEQFEKAQYTSNTEQASVTN